MFLERLSDKESLPGPVSPPRSCDHIKEGWQQLYQVPPSPPHNGDDSNNVSCLTSGEKSSNSTY